MRIDRSETRWNSNSRIRFIRILFSATDLPERKMHPYKDSFRKDQMWNKYYE